jgi:Hsp70 protein
MGDADLSVSVTREQFEELNAPLFTRCIDTVREVLADAKITIEQVPAAFTALLLLLLLSVANATLVGAFACIASALNVTVLISRQ